MDQVPNWQHYGGEQLEKLMAVFLLRTNIDAHSRTPSSGDGGVDIFEPFADGYRVYQVKSFSGRIGASQRRQIHASLRRVIDDPRLDKPVREWILVVPTTFTSSEERWFRDLTKSCSFNCRWRDEAFWLSCCAEYPEVVDFYLFNSQDRLKEQLADLADLIRDPPNELLPAQIEGRISSLRELINKGSPFYRYEIRTSQHILDRLEPSAGYVTSKISGNDELGYLAWDVYTRFPEAPIWDPIRVQFSVQLTDEHGEWDITEAYNEHVAFGRNLDLPYGAVRDLKITAPGGLDDFAEVAGGSIGGLNDRRFHPQVWRLEAEDEDGGLRASIAVNVQRMTTGQTGHQITGADCFDTLVFVLEVTSSEPSAASMSLKLNDITGKRAVDVLQVMQFVAALEQGHEVILRPEYGPQDFGRTALNTLDRDSDGLKTIVRLIEDLATVQAETHIPVAVPESMSADDRDALAKVAQLLRERERQGEWHKATFEFPGESTAEEFLAEFVSGSQLPIEVPLTAHVAGTVYDLGKKYIILNDTIAGRGNDPLTVEFCPGIDPTFIECLEPIQEPWMLRSNGPIIEI